MLADWTLALIFRRDTAQLTSLEHATDDFREAFREEGLLPGYWTKHKKDS